MPTVAELELEIYKLKQELQKARKDKDPESVKNYTFYTQTGETSLLELFKNKEFLFVIHNMGIECSYCTLWADTLNPMLPWINSKAEVALCNSDSLEIQSQMKISRKWNFNMIQDPNRTMALDLGYAQTDSSSGNEETYLHPGISAFKKLPDGSIIRLNHTQFGPGDDFCPIWPLWDLIGGTDWEPEDPKEKL